MGFSGGYTSDPLLKQSLRPEQQAIKLQTKSSQISRQIRSHTPSTLSPKEIIRFLDKR